MWTPPGYPVDASIALPSHSGCQSEPCNGLNASRSRAEKRSISRRTRLASLVESPVAFNDLRAPHPRRAALVRVTLSTANARARAGIEAHTGPVQAGDGGT